LAINDIRDWIRDNRNNALFTVLFTGPRAAIDGLVDVLNGLLRSIGWPGVLAAFTALGLLAGGWRLALIQLTGFVSLGVLGLWDSSIDTLAAIVVAVGISLALGIPLGILSAGNRVFRRAITPILDVMQIMPTIAYLTPFVLFFGIGGAAAVIVTLIYAMPAAIRITELGLRDVPSATIEAGHSLGATGRQLLTKVRLPLARPALGLAVNQTLMLALSMIVITALIDAPGLGQETLRGLIRNDVGLMFQSGLAIVILAVVLDRLTERASVRLDARSQDARSRLDRRVVVVIAAALVLAVLAGWAVAGLRQFPEDIEVSLRRPVNDAVDWLRTNAAWLTGGLKDAVSYGILNPLQAILTSAPWWLVTGVIGGIAVLISGLRPAAVAVVCLLLILAMGLWLHAMETLLQVLAATLLTFGIGLALGILSARFDRFSAVLRPMLDAAQTMPSFVYLVPAFVLFGVGRFTAIFAAIIFALPPVIRIVEVGLRGVPPAIVDAATSAGATGWQLLTKVELPVARSALLLAANQAVILVLSMVVVGGLVGGEALGYDVIAGFSQNRLFGLGLAAGIALVLLGIMLDRVTQGAGGRTRIRADG
jgi:glycine betaine/proline transport system permease protein